MRTLVYVPLLYTEVHLGPAAGAPRGAAQRQPDGWGERQALLRETWRGVAQRLDELDLPYPTTRVYQDGLPICGREDAIVRELAARGSLNHRLIVALQDRGARLVGTEDPRHLIAEHQRLQRVKALRRQAQGGVEQAAALQALRGEGDALLRERDAFIARRIDQTLLPGETAVVLLGLPHRVDEHLVGRCALRLIIHNLPFWSGLDPGASYAGDQARDLKERPPHG